LPRHTLEMSCWEPPMATAACDWLEYTAIVAPVSRLNC
jgi:hypothetical protein